MYKIGVPIRDMFYVYDSDSNPVTGLTDSDFNKELRFNYSPTTETVIISEKGEGFYYVEFTPEKKGFYDLRITHPTYNTKGWVSSYNVLENDEDDIIEIVKRTLGLVQENFYMDNYTFNEKGLMTSCRIRIYSDASSVGSDNNVIATYSVTANYNAEGEIESYKVVKE